MTTALEIAKEVLHQYAEGNDYTSENSATLAAEVVRLSELLQMTDLIAEGCESGAEGGTDAVLQSTTPAVRNAALTEAANIAQEVGAYDARIKAYEFRWTKMRAHIEELEADNQRLREALEGVRDSLCDPSECFSHHQGHKAARTARAALKEESR